MSTKKPAYSDLADENRALKAENTLLKQGNVTLAVASTFNTLIRYGALVAMSWFGYLSIAALAGHHTLASIGIRVLGSMQINQALAWALAGGGSFYGLGQRHQKKKTIEAMTNRIHELEERIDPERSSSHLTTRGDTRPEDRI